ncbi:MAG: hypothetical protein ACQESY_11525, partial [Pseudomonadota bacterium]
MTSRSPLVIPALSRNPVSNEDGCQVGLCRACAGPWPGTRHDQQKAPRHSGLEPESSLEQRRVPGR